jgi:hypothetical protein
LRSHLRKYATTFCTPELYRARQFNGPFVSVATSARKWFGFEFEKIAVCCGQNPRSMRLVELRTQALLTYRRTCVRSHAPPHVPIRSAAFRHSDDPDRYQNPVHVATLPRKTVPTERSWHRHFHLNVYATTYCGACLDDRSTSRSRPSVRRGAGGLRTSRRMPVPRRADRSYCGDRAA